MNEINGDRAAAMEKAGKELSDDFLRHAVVATSQYDDTCASMAAEILRLREMWIFQKQRIEKLEDKNWRFAELTPTRKYTQLREALETHLKWLRFHIAESHVENNEAARTSYQHAADMLQALLTQPNCGFIETPAQTSVSPLADRLELVREVLLSSGACSAATVIGEAITTLNKHQKVAQSV